MRCSLRYLPRAWALGATGRGPNGGGTTLTFSSAPANGTNNVYVIHRSGNNDSMTIQSGISATLSDATISGTLTVSSGTLTVSGSGSKVNFSNLPTSDPGVAGQLYRDSGTVKVSV